MTLLLDAISASASAAYSTRKLRSAYSGYCMQIKRTNDGVTADIGFSGNSVDEAAILAHCGSNPGELTVWYDQSGNGRNSSASGYGPTICTSGAIRKVNSKPVLYYENGINAVNTYQFAAPSTNFWMSMIVGLNVHTYLDGIFNDGGGFFVGGLYGQLGDNRFGNPENNAFQFNDSGSAPSSPNLAKDITDGDLYQYIGTYTSADAATLYLDAETPVTTNTGGAWSAGSAGGFILGGYEPGGPNTYNLDGWIPEHICGKTALSSTDRAIIQASNAAYWGVVGPSVTAYTLTAAQGAFTLTGQAMSPKVGRKVSAAQGSVSLSGQAATLRAARKIVAAQGSTVLSGQAASFRLTRALSAGQGSVALSGLAAALRAARKLSATFGTLALNGQSAGLRRAYPLVAGQGAFTLSGQAAAFRLTRAVIAGQGAIALSGQSAGLKATRRLVAAVGSITLTGFAAGLQTSGSFTFTAATGTVGLAGQAATFRFTRAVTAATGSVNLTGQAARLAVQRKMVAAVGSFSLSGQAAGLGRGLRVTAVQGAITLAGQSSAFRLARVLSSGAGLFVVTGIDATLTRTHAVVIEPPPSRTAYSARGSRASSSAQRQRTAYSRR